MSKSERKQPTGKKGGRGTHGSLTKAGKVRDQVRSQQGLSQSNLQEYHKQKRENRKKCIPRTANRKKYLKRFVLSKQGK